LKYSSDFKTKRTMNYENVGAKPTYLSDEAIAFINAVKKKYDLTDERIFSRYRPFPQIRQVMYYYLRNKFQGSFVAIGKYFKKNHATVIHAVKQSELILGNEHDDFHYIYEEIEQIYKNKTSPEILDVMFELNYRRNAIR